MNECTASKEEELTPEQAQQLALVPKLLAAVFGTEARIDELAAAGVVPLESRVYNFESNDGPIGKRLAALEAHTNCPRGDV
jgi:hypothetical protein